MKTSAAVMSAMLAVSCTPSVGTDAQFAEKLAQTLVTACPMADAADEAARHQCAAALTDATLLRDTMNAPFLWGQQQEAGVIELETHTTRFDPRVFRRMYLSLYAFPPTHEVETDAQGRTLLRVQPRFRNRLDMGSYPYPFWHRAGKWTSYQQATDLVFIIKQGRLLGALRSFEVDATREMVAHEWSGQWSWKRGDTVMPFVTLYGYLFSKTNPHVGALDAAYRVMEQELRSQNCLACHSPDNAVAMAQLELFSYPNQALSGRHRIVKALEQKTMPIADADRNIAGSFTDEASRLRALDAAKKFAQLGDQALTFEGEAVTAE